MTQAPLPQDPMAHDGSSRPQQAARAVLALLLTLLGLWTLYRYLPALIWAPILAIAVWPLYQRATRRWPPGKHNILLPAAFTLVIGLMFIVPLVLVGVQAGKEVRGLYHTIDKAQTDGLPPPEWLGKLPVGSQQATDWWNENLANPDSASELLQKARQSNLVSNGRELGADIAHRAVLFGFTLLTLFFLFKDGDQVNAQLQRASARAFGPGGERVGRQMIASVHGTVDGLVLVGLGEGFILGIGYLVTERATSHSVRSVHRHRRHGAVWRAAGVRYRGADPADARVGGIGHHHRRAGVRSDLRRRPLYPPDSNRQRDTAALSVGAARHPRWRRDLGTARPVPGTRDHGRPDAAVARVGGWARRKMNS